MWRINKESLPLAGLFRPVKEPILSTLFTWLEMIERDKHYSLFGLFVNDKENNIDTCGLYYKNMLIVNDNRKWRHKLNCHSRSVNYAPGVIINAPKEHL
jgi:hypothetical protein